MQIGYVVVPYQTSSGKQPFEEWLNQLRRRNGSAAQAIDARLARIRDKGNFGDCRSVGQRVCELRVHFGPGLRVYYLAYGPNIVVLLVGGDKRSQPRDIEKARAFAADFWRRI